MAVYLVCYDLRNEFGSGDYEALFDRIKMYDCHRIQDSAWLVASTASAYQVRAFLADAIDDDDLLWVSRVQKGEFSFTKSKGGTKNFLKKHGLQ